jgi:hypothetical protein
MAKKRTKTTPTVTESPAPSPESRLLDRALGAVSLGIDTIEAAITSAASVVQESIDGGDYDKDAASHLAWLTGGAARIAGEIRKAEAHDQSQLKKLTTATVLEWYRQLSDDERADLQRRIDSLQRGDSVLALG